MCLLIELFISIGLIMGGKFYKPKGRIEHASHDQTYLVHGRSRRCGPTLMARNLRSAEILSSEKSVSMVHKINNFKERYAPKFKALTTSRSLPDI